MSESTGKTLTPANQNPWYILMTLYGEQDGEKIDWDLHKKNRRAWNAWMGQWMTPEAQDEAAKSSGIEIAELRAWGDLKGEISRRFSQEIKQRNEQGFDAPELPGKPDFLDLSEISFSKPIVLEKLIFGAAAWFDKATFSAAAWFDKATFSADA